ncbi:hypothetical protein M422DRAFT_213923 [Sphaerobolus stellatus SS14]|uniref:C3H1-type domain-containing protein n=1 Tax=Sphaerobolus stellatus (strain SS14) TaxID=990650 RepID=A0A0C9UT12_SPHS4|nr:hypothetical protein M422DRAFT_213923 [Sphaerobolus stellatus SS14]
MADSHSRRPGVTMDSNRGDNDFYELQDILFQQSVLLEQQANIFKRSVEAQNQLREQLDEASKASEIADKQVEFWKAAYREEIKKNEKLQDFSQALASRLSSIDSARDRDSIILVVIDGDGNIFKEDLLKRGKDGGREAAQILHEHIWAHCSSLVNGKLSAQLWTYMFLNLKGLQGTLVATGICTATEFEDFITGFNQANPRFTINDVHSGKEAADTKIKTYLQTWSRFGQVLRVYFGGGHDNGYYPTLAELQSEGLLDKVTLLRGYQDIAHEIGSLRLPTLSIGSLFMSSKIPPKQPTTTVKQPSPPPSPVAIKKETKTLVQKAATSASPEQLPPLGSQLTELVTADGRQLKRLNPNVKLHKNDPPPCNAFYLSSCNKVDCKFSHDYVFTAEQFEKLKAIVKKSPCPFVNSGAICPLGDKCTMGHKCPRGAQCFHHKGKKCWFRGKTMHD